MTLIGDLNKLKNMFSKAQWDSAVNKIKKVTEDEAGIIERMFLRTTSTWEHDVSFTVKSEMSSNDISVTISTDDKIYFYLNYGTSIRYATMSPDFKPKSTYRTIGSRGGAGQKLYVNKRFPREGIEAREWADEIYIRRSPMYLNKILRIMRYATSR